MHETATVFATEPSSSFFSPVSPCEPITIRSARSLATIDARWCAMVPTTYRGVALAPARLSAAVADFNTFAASLLW